jgi:hypothetical protein
VAEDIAAAFAATDYRVRLARGGSATVRVGDVLPEALKDLVGGHRWGFITAWNPQARHRARHENRLAQRRLLAALRKAGALAILPAVGSGPEWREPGLFVIGPDIATLDRLARVHRQLAYVHGHGGTVAQLRWIAD